MPPSSPPDACPDSPAAGFALSASVLWLAVLLVLFGVGGLRALVDFSIPLAGAALLCGFLFQVRARVARLVTLFLGGGYLLALGGAYHRCFVMGRIDRKFGGPHGNFLFSGSLACLCHLVLTCLFALTLHLVTIGRPAPWSRLIYVLTVGLGGFT
ncbi:MAG: hypothetical protein JSS02_25605, partial [Planctomycetes bacterium]|nr:hypothetical protein [Planctomycetota bacterium]